MSFWIHKTNCEVFIFLNEKTKRRSLNILLDEVRDRHKALPNHLQLNGIVRHDRGFLRDSELHAHEFTSDLLLTDSDSEFRKGSYSQPIAGADDRGGAILLDDCWSRYGKANRQVCSVEHRGVKALTRPPAINVPLRMRLDIEVVGHTADIFQSWARC